MRTGISATQLAVLQKQCHKKVSGDTDTALGLTKLRMWFRNWRPVKNHWYPSDCHLIAPRSKTLLISLLVLSHSSNLLRPDFLCDFLILYLLSLFKSHHAFQAHVVAHSVHYYLMSIAFSQSSNSSIMAVLIYHMACITGLIFDNCLWDKLVLSKITSKLNRLVWTREWFTTDVT